MVGVQRQIIERRRKDQRKLRRADVEKPVERMFAIGENRLAVRRDVESKSWTNSDETRANRFVQLFHQMLRVDAAESKGKLVQISVRRRVKNALDVFDRRTLQMRLRRNDFQRFQRNEPVEKHFGQLKFVRGEKTESTQILQTFQRELFGEDRVKADGNFHLENQRFQMIVRRQSEIVALNLITRTTNAEVMQIQLLPTRSDRRFDHLFEGETRNRTNVSQISFVTDEIQRQKRSTRPKNLRRGVDEEK